VRGGTACLFASPLEPERLHALLGNWLPGGAQRLAFADAERGLHRTVMIEEEQLAAALFVGPERDEAAFERTLSLFEAGAPLAAAERAGLLAGRTAQGGDASPIVCSCHGVRRARIEVAIDGGALDLDAIGAACAAGTNCGSCRPEIKGILHAHQRLPAVIEAA
jgi:assimilatory nitrate reductase catalytic subunit